MPIKNNEPSQVNSAPDMERVREKLLLALDQYGETIPELITKIPSQGMGANMMLMSLRPLLPVFMDSLEKAIEDAPEENLETLVRLIGEVNEWINAD